MNFKLNLKLLLFCFVATICLTCCNKGGIEPIKIVPLYERIAIKWDATHSDSALLQRPADFYTSESKYPLLIFFHGTEESQQASGNLDSLNGVAKILLHDSTRLYNFVTLCPQDADGFRAPEQVNAIINYAIENYHIDTTRIYLTGVSVGAQNILNYVTQNLNYANRVAAIAPMSTIPLDATHSEDLKFVAQTQLHTRIYIGKSDYNNLVPNKNYAAIINNYSPGLAEYIEFIGGHNNAGWDAQYARSNSPNLYQWFLQYHR